MSFYLFFFLSNSLTRSNNSIDLHLGITLENISCGFRCTWNPVPQMLAAANRACGGIPTVAGCGECASAERRRYERQVPWHQACLHGPRPLGGRRAREGPGLPRAIDGVFFLVSFLLSYSPVTVIKPWKIIFKNIDVSFPLSIFTKSL